MLKRVAGDQREWLRLDLVAGLTTAAVVVPKAMAYATIAGLPVEAGLYTALVPMVIYAILGTSRPLSVSTTTTLAILTGTQLALVVPNGDPAMLLTASATLACLVGVMLILASLLRLGVVAMDLRAVPDLEYSALKLLIEGEERLRERGAELWLVAMNPEVLRVVQRSSLGETLGRERMVFNLRSTVDRYLSQPARPEAN